MPNASGGWYNILVARAPEEPVRSFSKLFSLILFGCIVLSSGCSHYIRPPESLETLNHPKVRKQSTLNFPPFIANGKCGYSDGNNGGNAHFQWEQSGDQFSILLFSPFGGGSIKMTGNSKHVFYQRDKESLIAASTPEAIVEKELGWIIPVSGLRYWLLGVPAPHTKVKQLKLDQDQRIWQIEQDGWTIIFQAYQTFGEREVPAKLSLKNGPIRLKFIFNRWKTDPSY